MYPFGHIEKTLYDLQQLRTNLGDILQRILTQCSNYIIYNSNQ